jgi:hypothetical protein
MAVLVDLSEISSGIFITNSPGISISTPPWVFKRDLQWLTPLCIRNEQKLLAHWLIDLGRIHREHWVGCDISRFIPINNRFPFLAKRHRTTSLVRKLGSWSGLKTLAHELAAKGYIHIAAVNSLRPAHEVFIIFPTTELIEIALAVELSKP